MGLHELYGTDQQAEEDGAWVTFGDGIALRIRSLRSKRVRRVSEGHQKRYYRKGFTTPDEQEAIAIDICVAAIAEWRGVTDANGAPVPSTTGHVTKVVTEYPWLRDDILIAMRSRETYRVDGVETQGKDSGSASDASSPPVAIESTSSEAS